MGARLGKMKDKAKEKINKQFTGPKKLRKPELQEIYDSMGDEDQLGYVGDNGSINKINKAELGNILSGMGEQDYLEEDPADTAKFNQELIQQEFESNPTEESTNAETGEPTSIFAKPGDSPEQALARKEKIKASMDEIDKELADGSISVEEANIRKDLIQKTAMGAPSPFSDKAQKKIDEAKFPRMRKWWENLKAQFGSERTKEQKIENAAFPNARAGWEGAKGKGGELLFGKPEFENFTPEQQKLIGRLGQLGIKGLEKGGGEFEPIEQEYLKKFKTQIAPSIAERYAGQDALNSGAFRGEIASAGKDLAGTLAALKSGHQTQQQGHFANLAQLGITPKFPNATYDPNSANGLLGSLAPLAIKAAGSYLTGL